MNSEHNFAWLAGILEGEGYIRRKNGYPSIELGMGDRDVVLRARSILNPSITRELTPEPTPTGVRYRCSVTGSKAYSTLIRIFPYMGARRQAQIEEALNG